MISEQFPRSAKFTDRSPTGEDYRTIGLTAFGDDADITGRLDLFVGPDFLQLEPFRFRSLVNDGLWNLSELCRLWAADR